MLVLETANKIEIYKAIRQITGLEWLDERAQSFPPDEQFYWDDDPEKKIDGCVYLVCSNQDGLRDFLSLGRQWRDQPESIRFPRGSGPWKDFFASLKDIRHWEAQDRLRETGLLEDWRERRQAGQERIEVEIELWFHERKERRTAVEQSLRRLLQEAGGNLLDASAIEEIRYHALLAELPISAWNMLEEAPDIRLTRCGDVMFLRPRGQTSFEVPMDEPVDGPTLEASALGANLPPSVALLDGLPLQNHQTLKNRLLVDDPDGWEASYPARDRIHGTSMASLILHGDLTAPGPPLERPLYVRPILRPQEQAFSSPSPEEIPRDRLALDLVFRAVRRLFEGEGTEPPAAPTIKIINFSIGDQCRPFIDSMSPWAKLLDYLAWRYRVLFLVSAGNHSRLTLNLSPEEWDRIASQPQEIQAAVLRNLIDQPLQRRLLAPAEAINVLTIGASHEDSSGARPISHQIDPLPSPGLPNPVNGQGPGFRNAIKPEILAPGGRQFYRNPLERSQGIRLEPLSPSSRPPGIKIAAPSSEPGNLNATRYSTGTSCATALATRTAAQIHQMLAKQIETQALEAIPEDLWAVVLKALLVHGSQWGEASATLDAHLARRESNRRKKKALQRLLGYGRLDSARVLGCTDQRVSLLGYGRLPPEQAHRYALPLPPGLRGGTEWRRLSITLAWLSPIHPGHRDYRKARLDFEAYGDIIGKSAKNLLGVERSQFDHHAVRRGTVQHEVFENQRRAMSFQEGDELHLQVNCRTEAGKLEKNESIPYAIVATLEIAETLALSIYEEVRARIQPRIRIAPPV